MQRRDFLKLAALAVGSLFGPLAFPWQAAAARAASVAYGGKLYRTGHRGTILVSDNRGSTWKRHTDLGNTYSVKHLAVRGHRLVASVGYAGRTFDLRLAPDYKRWLTTR
jgi:photosystem II stability/assembly factor-like uncharacterized protein